MPTRRPENSKLLRDNEELKARLAEAEEALTAIRTGAVDALVVTTEQGTRLFTLEGAEHVYRTLIEDMNEGAFTLSKDATLLYCNSRFADMVGWPLPKMVGRCPAEFVAREDRPKCLAVLKSSRTQASRTRWTLVPAQGGTLPVQLSLHPLKMAGEPCVGGVVTDLTPVLMQEMELRRLLQEQARLAAIIASSNDAIVGQTLDGVVTSWNQAASRLYGYTEADMLGAPISVLLPPDRLGENHAILQRIAQGHVIQPYETIRLRKDGTAVDVSLTVSPIRDAEGQIIGVSDIARDIAERKRAELALAASELRYRRLFEAAKDGILILSPDTNRIVDVNPYLTDLLGYSRDEMLGKALWEIGFSRDVVESKLTFADLKQSGYVKYDDLPLRGKDGRKFEVEFVSNVYQVAGTSVIQCNVRNVTERKQIERHAGRLQRLATLGQLLGGIAHEIKNPLFVLTGRVQLLKEKLAERDYDTLPSDLDKIDEAAKRMTRITERFLTLARPVQPLQTRCDIRAILDETLEFLSNELMKNKIRLVIESPPDLPAIRSDPRQLQEAFLNLLLNAVQAMMAAHGQGTLRVSAALVTNEETRGPGDAEKEERQGDTETGGRGDTESAASPSLPVSASAVAGQGEGAQWIEVRIQDDGPGILPEHQARMFEPFFSTKPAGEGTGLGLWTVRTAILGLQGRVTYETKVGEGTTFIVRLPVLR